MERCEKDSVCEEELKMLFQNIVLDKDCTLSSVEDRNVALQDLFGCSDDHASVSPPAPLERTTSSSDMLSVCSYASTGSSNNSSSSSSSKKRKRGGGVYFVPSCD